jgi:hypothetical protein
MHTKGPVTIYISAASELMAERETLARMIATLPVTLAWHIVQTPIRDTDSLDLEALLSADLHILVMGSDIRAPVGLELLTAHRANRPILTYLKRAVPRTPAGQVFIRDAQVVWRPFQTATDLSQQVQRMLVEHLVRSAHMYDLTPDEVAQLEALPSQDASNEPTAQSNEAGRSAVILSHERFEPRDGIVVEES